jgi:hypothetical protein
VARAIVILLAVVTLAGCGGGGRTGFGEGKSAAQIIDQLEESGLPISDVQVYTSATDPNELLGRPGQYVDKASFVDTRMNEPVMKDETDTSDGGSVEVFDDEGDAEERADYVRSITEGNGPSAEYSYLRGQVLLRVSGKLTPAQAKAYEQAFQAVKAPQRID